MGPGSRRPGAAHRWLRQAMGRAAKLVGLLDSDDADVWGPALAALAAMAMVGMVGTVPASA